MQTLWSLCLPDPAARAALCAHRKTLPHPAADCPAHTPCACQPLQRELPSVRLALRHHGTGRLLVVEAVPGELCTINTKSRPLAIALSQSKVSWARAEGIAPAGAWQC